MPETDPLEGLPTLEDYGHDRESVLAALREKKLPNLPVALATMHIPVFEGDFIAIVERARREALDDPSARLFFRAIHLLGGCRRAAAYRPVIAFLREAREEQLAYLLRDAVGETLPSILVGLFDGGIGPLETLMADEDADQFGRNAAFCAYAFLTFEGRIARDWATAFLTQFESKGRTRTESLVWHGWMVAVGLLGLEQLAPRVKAALDERRIPLAESSESFFRNLLRNARERPTDIARFEDEGIGYIEDTLATLREVDAFEFEEDIEDFPELLFPAVNPYRNVGRNDPCPCGSGKKFKKCHGAT